MRASREKLLEKLEQVKWGLASREIIEQSASYVFKGGRIITFNDEVFCQVDYETGIEGAVHAQPLLELLGKLSEDHVDIEAKDTELLVRGKNNRAAIRMDKEIALPIEDMEVPDKWHELGTEFTDAIEIVQSCASKEDSNFNLTCIHIHPEFLEACDNFQLIRYPLKTGVENRCLVRKDAVKQITGLGIHEVSEGKSWLHFRSVDGLQLSCRKWEDEYQDLSDILNCSGSKVVLPRGLPEAIEKAEIFSSDNPEDNQVRVELKEGKLRLKGQGAHGWYEERRKAEYSGEDVTFLISPQLLVEITKRTNECEVLPGRLKIDAGKFVYIACLGEAEG